jgi:hypothetical protein
MSSKQARVRRQPAADDEAEAEAEAEADEDVDLTEASQG